MVILTTGRVKRLLWFWQQPLKREDPGVQGSYRSATYRREKRTSLTKMESICLGFVQLFLLEKATGFQFPGCQGSPSISIA